MVAVGDTLYMWRNGDGSERSAFAFARLYRSVDLGLSWWFTGVEFSRADGDFAGADHGFFSPTFVQFGRGAPAGSDGFVYVFAPEVVDPSHWDIQKPGRVALLRVRTGDLEIDDAWEYYAGMDEGEPLWTSLARERVAAWEDPVDGAHRLAVSYNAGLARYLLTTMTVDRSGWFSLYAAPTPWGPWRTVLVEHDPERWGRKVVVFNFVNKWLGGNGREFVLVYTRNDRWATIEGAFQVAPSTGSSPTPSG
jgi:hypothetical protein